ncbi:hypothetical protein Plec18170_003900 [Paecilomyces lecythidis]
MLAAPLNSQWNANMIPLEAYFGSPRGQRRAYTAVTDGQLQNLSSKEILAFLECKRGLRLKHSPQVEMQENAQAVAWVKEYPDTTPRPCTPWINYLNGGKIATAGHATMNRFGPYIIRNRSDMTRFARIIIAIMLYVD